MTRRLHWKHLLGTASAGTAAVAAIAVVAPQATATQTDTAEAPAGTAQHAQRTKPTKPSADPAVKSPATTADKVDYETWKKDVKAVMDEAAPYVKDRVAEADGEKQAIVLDVDNTALETGLNFSIPQHAVQPVLELAQYAHSKGADIFFVTARPDIIEPITKANLDQVGYPVEDLQVRHFPDFFHGAAEYKTAKRADIEAKGYNIIANIGNTPSDLEGGHAERTFKLPDYDGQLS